MLSTRKLQAAELVAEDRLKNRDIAAKIGISLRTLDNWKADPEFQAEVDRILRRWEQHIFQKGIADRRRRLYRLNDRWRRLQAVIEKRAAAGRQLMKEHLASLTDPEDSKVPPYPGIDTGLIVLKPSKFGIVAEVDTGLLSEIRAHEQQAAIELGQWKTKHEITGPDDGPLQVAAVKLAELFSVEELEGIEKRMTAATPETP